MASSSFTCSNTAAAELTRDQILDQLNQPTAWLMQHKSGTALIWCDMPLCSHLYSDPTRLVSRWDARPLAGPVPEIQ